MKNTYEILKAWAKDILKKQSTSLKITFIWERCCLEEELFCKNDDNHSL